MLVEITSLLTQSKEFYLHPYTPATKNDQHQLVFFRTETHSSESQSR